MGRKEEQKQWPSKEFFGTHLTIAVRYSDRAIEKRERDLRLSREPRVRCGKRGESERARPLCSGEREREREIRGSKRRRKGIEKRGSA